MKQNIIKTNDPFQVLQEKDFSAFVATCEKITGFNALTDENEDTLLICAVRKSLAAETLWLLANGAYPDWVGEMGYTALHHAAVRGHYGIVSSLIDHKASVNLRESCGQTALHKAVSAHHSNIVNALLAAGSEVNTIDAEGFTPLDLLFENVVLAKQLKVAGAEISKVKTPALA